MLRIFFILMLGMGEDCPLINFGLTDSYGASDFSIYGFTYLHNRMQSVGTSNLVVPTRSVGTSKNLRLEANGYSICHPGISIF